MLMKQPKPVVEWTFWQERIILGRLEDIHRGARYSFESAAPGGGFIMGVNHSLAVDDKRENILELKRYRD